MKFLIDMNLSPEWVSTFQKNGYQAAHWTSVGAVNASDREIMNFAVENDWIIFTHDLDFGDILAATGGESPSVIQARINDTTPEVLGPYLFKAIEQFKNKLERGSLITIVPGKMRARILPLINR